VHESVAAFLGTMKKPDRAVTQTGSATGREIGGTVDDSDEVGVELMRAFGGAGGIIAADIQAP